MKRPSFQFYPADWRNHLGLRSCSPAARSMWIDMMCLMHDGDPYGYLKVGDKVIPKDNLKVLLGFTLPEMEGYLAELKSANLYQLDEEGCIFSPRMVRDERIRVIRSAGGSKGGNPVLLKHRKVNLPDNLDTNLGSNQKITPSSSSSSSSTKEINKESPAEPTPAEKLRARIRSWFGQQETTLWGEKEKKAFAKVLKLKTTPEDIDILEAYYTAKEKEFRRADHVTLMNNWNGEIVRAKKWKQGTLNFSVNGSSQGIPAGQRARILEKEIETLQAETQYPWEDSNKFAALKAKKAELSALMKPHDAQQF